MSRFTDIQAVSTDVRRSLNIQSRGSAILSETLSYGFKIIVQGLGDSSVSKVPVMQVSDPKFSPQNQCENMNVVDALNSSAWKIEMGGSLSFTIQIDLTVVESANSKSVREPISKSKVVTHL